ncbi:hypothetical protein ACFCYH_08000 [Streptomyces sp. NPDC056400]
MITLYQLLGESFVVREQPNGLAEIFLDHRSWMVTQDRYQFDAAEPARSS